MHPEEDLRIVFVLVQPAQRGARNVLGPAHGMQDLVRAGHFLVIEVEVPVQVRQAADQRPRAHERGGRVAEAAQDLRYCQPFGVVREGYAVDAGAVLLRIAPGEHREVRRAGHRNRAVGAFKPNPLVRQAIHDGTCSEVIAVRR